jgi:hypothetical protein
MISRLRFEDVDRKERQERWVVLAREHQHDDGFDSSWIADENDGLWYQDWQRCDHDLFVRFCPGCWRPLYVFGALDCIHLAAILDSIDGHAFMNETWITRERRR